MLPLARPGLAVTAFFTFLTAWGEVAYASAFIQTDSKFTLAYGLQQFVPQFNPQWEYLTASAVLIMIPAGLAFFFAQRHLVSGLPPAGPRAEPRDEPAGRAGHDGSARYVPQPTPALGEHGRRCCLRAPAAAGVRRVHVRTTPDARAALRARPLWTVAAGGDTWWRAEVEVRNPVTRYRFLLDTAAAVHSGSPRLGVVGHDVADNTDFRLVAYDPPPRLGRRRGGLPDLPGPVRPLGRGRPAPAAGLGHPV